MEISYEIKRQLTANIKMRLKDSLKAVWGWVRFLVLVPKWFQEKQGIPPLQERHDDKNLSNHFNVVLCWKDLVVIGANLTYSYCKEDECYRIYAPSSNGGIEFKEKP